MHWHGGMLLQLSYTSRATRPMTPEELVTLAAEAARKNRVRGITGVMLCDAGAFIQILEGEAADVEALFARIQRDPRHAQITLLQRTQVKQRSFPHWPMGLLELSAKDRNLPGVRQLLESRDVGPPAPEGTPPPSPPSRQR